MNDKFYLTLKCKHCDDSKIVDFDQIEGDIIPADTTINCKKSISKKHEWIAYWPCPECDQERLFPVNDDGEPLQGRCDICINNNDKLLN